MILVLFWTSYRLLLQGLYIYNSCAYRSWFINARWKNKWFRLWHSWKCSDKLWKSDFSYHIYRRSRPFVPYSRRIPQNAVFAFLLGSCKTVSIVHSFWKYHQDQLRIRDSPRAEDRIGYGLSLFLVGICIPCLIIQWRRIRTRTSLMRWWLTESLEEFWWWRQLQQWNCMGGARRF